MINSGAVVEAGVGLGNTPAPGNPQATGNALDNDTDIDAADARTVVGIVAGSSSSASTGGVGTTIVGVYGALVLAADGQWTYELDNDSPATQALTSQTDWYGGHQHQVSDVFTYTVADTAGATSVATLTIAIKGANDAPVAQPIFAEVSEDGSVAMLADWSDPEGNVNGSAFGPLPGLQGNIIKTNTFEVTYYTNGKFDYLAAGETATDTFAYTVFDVDGASSTATAIVTITGTNDAPVITELGGATSATAFQVPENTSDNFVFVTASDVDSPVLTYSLGANPDGSYDNHFFAIDPNSGALRFTTPPDFEFTDPGNDDLYKVQVTVSDGAGGTARRDYFVQVTDVVENGLGNGVFRAAYLTGSDPWGISPGDPGSPDASMNRAFGAGQWTKLNNSMSDAIFDAADFVYLDGGDGATGWFQNFVNSNRGAIVEFVEQGGTLFINAARWGGLDNFDLGFGVDLDDSEYSSTGIAINPGHQIFNGPNGSAGTSWSGSYFSHDTIDGAGLAALINGAAGTVLAENSYGNGHVLFGGITSSYFHSPDPQADILRANILDYAASFSADYII